MDKQQRGQRRILFIENDKMSARGYYGALKEHYEVFWESEAQKALDSVQDNRDLDLVVCDVMMPRPATWSPDLQEEDVGIWIFRQALPKVVEAGLPFLFLTGRKKKAVEDILQAMTVDGDLWEVLDKLQVSAKELYPYVDRSLLRAENYRKRRGPL